jgi:hypothetical protein
MNNKGEYKAAAILLGVFVLVYFLPVGVPRFDRSITSGSVSSSVC